MTYPRRSGDPRKRAATTTAEQAKLYGHASNYTEDPNLIHAAIEKLTLEGEDADWSDLLSSMKYEREAASIAGPVSQALREYYGDRGQ